MNKLGENSITLSPNDMESIISSANQYARDVERIDADNSVDSTDTSGLTSPKIGVFHYLLYVWWNRLSPFSP
jgi:hypothetical protein